MHALQLAAHWFEGARLTLFHAYTPPGAAVSAGRSASDSWRAVVVQESAAQFAASVLVPTLPAGIQQVLDRGGPGALLADHVASARVDRVVLGSQGRSGVARALLGGTAENLLNSLDCDTLVVRRA